MKADKNVFIQTIGCQMNVYDSERIETFLHSHGYQSVDSAQTADLIIVNTCAIRAKAEQKLYSLLGRLAPLKKRNPDLILAVGGCVAQQEGAAMLARIPALDLVFGTDALERMPTLVEKVAVKRVWLVDVGARSQGELTSPNPRLANGGGVSRFVTIMRGCDNYCTYCVVPYVRGRETSRPPESIVTEIEGLVAAGAREVTLLGQNVNSYGNKEGMLSFPDLLAMVNDIDGLARIRFTTSHPKDLSNSLVTAFSRLEKLCPHIHLPVQSGADRILARMNRKYTRTHYLDKIAQLREACPDIGITTDIIVGFPGESENEYDMTLDLLDTVRFDSLFAFMYSDRPNAKAARFTDKITEKVKTRRLQMVLERQEKIAAKIHKKLVGSVQEVLVEGKNSGRRGGQTQWSGRTPTHKIVNFTHQQAALDDNSDLTGQLLDVHITKGRLHSLGGEIVLATTENTSRKGVRYRAA